MALFRRIPPVRGRGRFENVLHGFLEERGFSDVLCVNGFEFEVSLDSLLGRTLYLNGVWERENTEICQRLVRSGGIIFDVGANIGYFTGLFSALTGPTGKVYAFEPVPSTAALLRRNLARNNPWTGNVTVVDVALSDHEGSLQLNVSGGRNPGASHVIASPVEDRGRLRAGVVETITIQCSTADLIWAAQGRPWVDLVKIDIEGHEYHALSGMHELISASPAISILVEVRESFLAAAGASSDRLFADLRELGLDSYDFDRRSGRFTINQKTRAGELILFSKRKLDQLPKSYPN